jgi:hypothetical protein
VEVYATDPLTGASVSARPLHRRTVGADGEWGPFGAQPGVTYEFVVQAPGLPVTHVYRSAFARTSSFVYLHAEPASAPGDGVKAIVTLARPRGCLVVPRDRLALDGRMPPDLVPGVAGVSSAVLPLTDSANRPVVAEFNGERIVARAWPARGHRVVIELTS